MLELNRILKEHPAKWMIWEGKPLLGSVQQLQALGVESLVFDPCGNKPDQGDFLGQFHCLDFVPKSIISPLCGLARGHSQCPGILGLYRQS